MGGHDLCGSQQLFIHSRLRETFSPPQASGLYPPMASNNYPFSSPTLMDHANSCANDPLSPIERSSIISLCDLISSPITHMPATSSLQAPSSSKKTLGRIYQPSPSPGSVIVSGSDTARDDSVRKGAITELPPHLIHAVLGALISDTFLNLEPFAFEPLHLASLIDPKSLENLERLGGIEGLLRGLGTSVRGVTTSGNSSREQGPVGPVTPPSAYQSTIEDRQRIFGHNILPQRSSRSLLRLIWQALHDKVLVSPMVAHSFPFI